MKALPKRTERALQSTVDLSKVAESVGGLPLVTKLQQLAARAQSLMEDVHSEATDLFAVSVSLSLFLSCTHTHTDTDRQTHRQTDTHTHTHTHTHTTSYTTHIHTHTDIHSLSLIHI